MRISHLIQTIQPDPKILTSVHEGDSFSKKTIMMTAKKTPEQSVFHFNFPMTGAANWSSRPDLTNEKCPENN